MTILITHPNLTALFISCENMKWCQVPMSEPKKVWGFWVILIWVFWWLIFVIIPNENGYQKIFWPKPKLNASPVNCVISSVQSDGGVK